jgi:hypothetical protein
VVVLFPMFSLINRGRSLGLAALLRYVGRRGLTGRSFTTWTWRHTKPLKDSSNREGSKEETYEPSDGEHEQVSA